MPRIAYWRSRGWNVLVPDHRGSTGHGRAYQQAMRGRWGELDVDDTIDCDRPRARQRLGHPATTRRSWASSAGGFTVLGVLAAARPTWSRAAVVSYPVTDLADLAERSHRFERHYTDSLVGPLPERAVAVRSSDRRCTSPIGFRTPLLVFHGDDDPVVPVEQSRVFVERCRAAGGDVELRRLRGRGPRLPAAGEPARRVPADQRPSSPRQRSWRIASPAVTDDGTRTIPTPTRVYYDLGDWSFDQQAELAAALADAEIPHAWDDNELMVPEEFEERHRRRRSPQVEERLGIDEPRRRRSMRRTARPEPIALGDDAPTTEYDLDEWGRASATSVTHALDRAGICRSGGRSDVLLVGHRATRVGRRDPRRDRDRRSTSTARRRDGRRRTPTSCRSRR